MSTSGSTVGTYTYNYLNQRTQKLVSGTTTNYVYGLNGQLYGEYTSAGALVREYIYLNGQPLAQVTAGSPEFVTYLHSDHLGTPRYGTNTAGTQVWNWASDAFGNGTPTGSVTVNLRMPGQYYDAETGLLYNWNRYYNPTLGRYITSDPIGLDGGLNTFNYVAQSPVMYVDPRGLDIDVVVNNNTPVTGTHAGVIVDTPGKDKLLYDPGGSYEPPSGEPVGTGRTVQGKDAELDPYVTYQKGDGPNVEVYHIRTTPAEDAEISARIDQQGGCAGGQCAICTGSALQGVGPFKDMGSTLTPKGLSSEMKKIQKTQNEEYNPYEDIDSVE